MTDKNRRWYAVQTYLAHQGTGRNLEAYVYVWAENTVHAMNKHMMIRGVRRNRFPLIIRALDNNESSELESDIIRDGLILGRARHSWYIPTNQFIN
jgi:hypothetical protein